MGGGQVHALPSTAGQRPVACYLRGMVDVKALIASIGRLSWKAGNVTGTVTHEIDAEGAHRIVVTVPKTFAKWDTPPTHTAPTAFREYPDMKWEDIKPPPPGTKKI